MLLANSLPNSDSADLETETGTHRANCVPVEIPQLQILEMPVVVQRQVSMVPTVQKPEDILQLQILHKVCNMPVVVERQAQLVLTGQKLVEMPLLQGLDKAVDRPVVVP